MAKRKHEKVISADTRVLTRFFTPSNEQRTMNVIDRVLSMSEEEAKEEMDSVLDEFSDRHRGFKELIYRNYERVMEHVPNHDSLSVSQRLLLGSYFTCEYSVESAALFNPSIVLHPNQDGLSPGKARFIMSFRATGEGHISSIEFRSGIIDENAEIWFDPISRYIERPEVQMNPAYDRRLFELKLHEMNLGNEISGFVLDNLPARFSFDELQSAIIKAREGNSFPESLQNETFHKMLWLARSNYLLKFRSDHRISERVIFPCSEAESRGIEDARFVRFVDDDGKVTYFATYTAYDGFNVLPQMIETKDFLTYKISTLNGRAVQNKGMALFPRKLGGHYFMLSRQDGENIHLMHSDNIHFWQTSSVLQIPERPWEYVQIGNCGSPIETEAGWLMMTHGVGAMRKYSLGMFLLDLEDPSRVISRLDTAILTANEYERDGYVPNVVYTCGMLLHYNQVIIPYAFADTSVGIATMDLDELLSRFADSK